ncbi:hypothetical protein BP5796_08416 [Coleophoma crateriformis]|uniref:gamma-glutamylcyclotransferase n=1 Tax=Coleophoma crateriformis TaxID=565419 RepID=A0A3D8R7K2_9HELO|nr:hypothetical protein BP5796_08416 [Coleophoma crateriformis]
MAAPTPASQSQSQSQPPRLYFAYGSNLSLTQMLSPTTGRCPTATYHSVGMLRHWRWLIGERGYANIVPSAADVVYGLLYTLQPADERVLDRAEGVPWAYQKIAMQVSSLSGLAALERECEVEALVYVDGLRLGEGVIWPEYVARMNRGIGDALAKGVPLEYVEKYLRPFVKEEGQGEVDEEG